MGPLALPLGWNPRPSVGVIPEREQAGLADREQEFRGFFDASFVPLRRLAYLLTRNWSEAEDLAQEAMVRTYRAWSRIRERPGPYARAVLLNRHRSLLRRARVEAKHTAAREPDQPVVPDMGEDHLVAWQALGELSPRQRQVLVLRFYEDLPVAEIAGLMGIPVGTVKSLTHRALARLRETLGEEAVPVVET